MIAICDLCGEKRDDCKPLAVCNHCEQSNEYNLLLQRTQKLEQAMKEAVSTLRMATSISYAERVGQAIGILNGCLWINGKK